MFLPISEETVFWGSLPPKKEANMRKVKPVVHKSYRRERKPVDVFAAVFLSNAAPSPIPTLISILL